MEPSRNEIRAWLRGALEKTGETPTGLARRAGVAQSTITRFLNDDDAPMMGLRSIAKIAHAAGIQPAGLPSAGSTRAGFGETDAAPYLAKDELAVAVDALIGGRNATDPWIMQSRVLEDAGYLPGDVLIVDLNGTPRAGDVVCAQVYRWNEGKAETVFRIYEPPYLVAASRDSAVRRPLLVDDDRVVIKGVVIASLRQRREG